MFTEDFKTAMSAAEDFLKKENPLRRCGADTYSKVVHTAFERIRTMRGKGFSLAQICGAYEKAGLLPENARAGSFRQAFQRERLRRLKEDELEKLVSDSKDGDGAEKKTAAADADKSGKGGETGTETPKQENAKERIKRLTGAVVDTGLGKSTRHSDGSFEYNN